MGSYAVAKALLVAGADVDHRSSSGNTALAFAAAGGFFSIVDVLVSNGADVTLRDGRGNTALHLARNRDAIELLVESGVSVNAK